MTVLPFLTVNLLSDNLLLLALYCTAIILGNKAKLTQRKDILHFFDG